jgi:hypothetical protein
MSDFIRRAGFLVGLAAGCFAALATVGFVFIPYPAVFWLILPGLCLNLGVRGLPSLPIWVCPIGNLVFYFLLFWLLGLLLSKAIGCRRNPAKL